MLLLLVAAGALYLHRRQARARPKPARPAKREAHPFRAVSVQYETESCMSARKITEKRYLAREAPPLPLPWCEERKCPCHYRFYDDRREPGDRRSRHGRLAEDFSQSQVFADRSRTDRRSKPTVH